MALRVVCGGLRELHGVIMQEPKAQGPPVSRRRLLKTTAGAAAGSIAVGAGGVLPKDRQAVGNADAIACGGVCIGAIAVGGAAVVGWALREYEVIGADTPPEGLTADGLRNDIYDSLRTRQSTNKSTFVDNRNIVDAGLKNTLYGKGKLAAIKALNDQKSESEVVAAASNAADSHASVVINNLFKSWNESVREVRSLVTAQENHPDVSNFVGTATEGGSAGSIDSSSIDPNASSEHTLPDGTTITVERLKLTSGSHTRTWSPLYKDFYQIGGSYHITVQRTDPEPILMCSYGPWHDIYSTLDNALSQAKTGLNQWTTEVYGKVQSGDLSTSDLMTADELAAIAADEESYNQAVADLMALNISINLEREAEIKLPNSNTTLFGSLGVTGDKTLNAGTTIDPSTVSEDYYLTYDVSEATGTWTEFKSAVDGGVVSLTAEPHPSTLFSIETAAQETAQVASSDFAAQGDGTWTADISSQVETAITTIDAIKFYSESDKTQMETILLDEPFKIVKFTDSSGESVDSASFSAPSEAHNDSNYLTEEEWKQREEQYREQIQKYEAASAGGGVAVGDLGPKSIVGGVVALAVTGAGFSLLS